MYHFKDQLNDIMVRRGITVANLATELEVSEQTVRHWISGRNHPARRVLPHLCKFLDATFDNQDGLTGRADLVESQMREEFREEIRCVLALPQQLRDSVFSLAQAYHRASAAQCPAM